jgi:hypothetical protein
VAYKKKELEKLALKAITSNPAIVFEDDVIQALPCGKGTYYNHKLNQLDSIKEALANNRTKTKQSLRTKWHESENATVQIALYKLIGSEDEADRLNGSRQKMEATITHSVDDEAIKKINSIYDRIRGTLG